MGVQLSRIDRAGVVLLGLWVVWVGASTLGHDASLGDALVYLTAPALAVMGVAAGLQLRARGMPTWFAAALPIFALYVVASVTLDGWAGGGLLNYSNANAALSIQLAAIAAMTALHTNGRSRAWALWAAALFAFSVPWTLSQAGIALLVAVAPALLLALLVPTIRAPWAVPVSAVVALAAGAVVLAVARMPEWPPIFTRMFSGARQQLWADAISLWARHPIEGAGPGAFAAYSALADDADTERVHMSVLQVGSELGLIGLALFGLLIIVALVKLAQRSSASALVGTAALTALLIHSFVDHLFEFPAVTFAAGMALGLATYSSAGAKYTEYGSIEPPR